LSIETTYDATRYLTRLLIVRGFMITLFSILIIHAINVTQTTSVYYAACTIIALWIIISIPLFPYRKQQHPMPATLLMRHIFIDIILLSGLLYFTGGYTNPLISFYFFPVLIAGLTSSRRNAWLSCALVITTYTILTRFFTPLPMMDTGMQHGFQFHLVGMWLTFVLSVLLLISVVIRMSEQRREQAQQLNELQQRSIRERTMVALGAQAASDAHELGTPINTLLLLVDELRLEPSDESLLIMQQQLQHCRNILTKLGSRARALSQRTAEVVTVAAWLKQSTAPWHNLHPHIRVHIHNIDAHISMMADPILEQLLFILLDNAMEAQASQIELTATEAGAMIQFTVQDNGTGFPPQLIHRFGHEPISTKSDSKGMGLYLAHFAMEQVQGHITCSNPEGGGAMVCFDIPQREIHD
jgi:two-component system sensor histidine kinase RegB